MHDSSWQHGVQPHVLFLVDRVQAILGGRAISGHKHRCRATISHRASTAISQPIRPLRPSQAILGVSQDLIRHSFICKNSRIDFAHQHSTFAHPQLAYTQSKSQANPKPKPTSSTSTLVSARCGLVGSVPEGGGGALPEEKAKRIKQIKNYIKHQRTQIKRILF